MAELNQSTKGSDKGSNNYLAINLLWLVITLLVFFAFVKLRLWQSDRAAEKTERLQRIEAMQVKSALSLTDVEAIRAEHHDLDMINDLPVMVTGVFAENIVFLLDNQMFNGKFGYRVLQLVHTEKQAVLVNLGWYEGDRTRQIKPDIKAIVGTVTLKGNVRVIEQGITLIEEVLNSDNWPVLIQQIELDKIAQLINLELLPFVVYLDKNESLGYQKNWQPIVMPPEKHQGYAFQWFSLAIAWLLLMIWAARKAKLAKT